MELIRPAASEVAVLGQRDSITFVAVKQLHRKPLTHVRGSVCYASAGPLFHRR